MCDISVVIPVRDEEKNIGPLCERLAVSLNCISDLYEIIFVTDVNRDLTFETICKKNSEDSRIKVVKLSNSHGQHVAVLAGLHRSSGRYTVIMDGDLQDCPEDIPVLYNKVLQGFDIVYGVKPKKNDSAVRNFFSKSFNSVMRWMSDTKMDVNSGMFRIISRKALDAICQFKEIQPSLTYIFGMINLPCCTAEISYGKRLAGETKYSFAKLIQFAVSSMLSFTLKPLKMIMASGITVIVASFIYLVCKIIGILFFHFPFGTGEWIIFLIMFIGGLQLTAAGISGEYMGRIYMQTKNRPLYIVEYEVGDFIFNRNISAEEEEKKI